MTAGNGRSTNRGRAARRRRAPSPRWTRLSDERLEEWRICDLGLKLEGTPLEARVERLHAQLEARGLRFRPHYWLSSEWFSPDDVPGIAIPFYLAHPRLMRLERKHMMEVEGGTRAACMKILRHEAGHAFQTAYQLQRRRRWQRLFGKDSDPYPEEYQPRPYSRRFVLHLDHWYAQSHPSEDFAETFAVWLAPRSNWRFQYRGWPAYRKLEYVDELMAEIAREKPRVESRRRVEPVARLRQTLGEHYRERRSRYGVEGPEIYDQDLKRLFTATPPRRKGEMAAAFLERNRSEIRRTVARWTGQYQYLIDRVLGDMITRCRTLRLHCDRSERGLFRNTLVVVTVQTLNYLHSGHHRLVL